MIKGRTVGLQHNSQQTDTVPSAFLKISTYVLKNFMVFSGMLDMMVSIVFSIPTGMEQNVT